MAEKTTLQDDQYRTGYEQAFLASIVNTLIGRDLSQLDLKTLPGNPHHAHSALFDNYEINITRTPVYVHRNKLAQLFGVGDWRFQEDVFERYEIFISENIKNIRAAEIVRYAGAPQIKTHNVIMARGTMATDRGYYPCPRNYFNSPDADEGLYFAQNAHLFAPAKNLYNIFDTEYKRRQAKIHSYPLSEMKSPDDYNAILMRVLGAITPKVK